MKPAALSPVCTVLEIPAGLPTQSARYAAEPWAALTRRRAAQGRERLAAKLFETDFILKQIDQAACEGLCFVRIDQTVPVTLRDTKAARKLSQALSEQQFTVAWLKVPFGLDRRDNKLGEAVEFEQLRISW